MKHDEDDNLKGNSIYIANPNVKTLAIHVGLKLFFLLYVQVHSPIICLSHNISTLFYSIFNNYINYIRWITIFSKRKKKGKKERWITILSKFSFHLISLIDSVQYDDPYHNKLTVPMKKIKLCLLVYCFSIRTTIIAPRPIQSFYLCEEFFYAYKSGLVLFLFFFIFLFLFL